MVETKVMVTDNDNTLPTLAETITTIPSAISSSNLIDLAKMNPTTGMTMNRNAIPIDTGQGDFVRAKYTRPRLSAYSNMINRVRVMMSNSSLKPPHLMKILLNDEHLCPLKVDFRILSYYSFFQSLYLGSHPKCGVFYDLHHVVIVKTE